MGTISGAFGIIAGALSADQAGLSIIAGNVANAGTPGYTRERPIFEESATVTINGKDYGTGVRETGSQSIRDRVLVERMDQQQQLASASSARLSALNLLQNLFAPASGASGANAGDIGAEITNFFDSFSPLEANPTSNALRQQVLSTAKLLAGDLANAAASVNAQQSALDQKAAGVANEVNALTASIAKLNRQIQAMSSDDDAGALEDERQDALSRLSELIGFNQVTTENNGLTITTTSGHTLIAEGVATSLSTGTVNGVTHFYVGSTDATTELASGGGELGGYLTARDQDAPQILAALDQLAFGIAVEVNGQNAKGIDLNGNAGAPIFSQTATAAGAAAGIKLAMADPNQIASASAGQGTGDNSNAIALANLGTSASPPILNGLTLPNGTVLAAGQTLLSGDTPSAFYSGFVTSLGSTVSQVETENNAQNASVTQLQTINNALSQVNLNDEAAALTTLQRSYQAAAQVFSMLNSIMAAAINLGQQTAVS